MPLKLEGLRLAYAHFLGRKPQDAQVKSLANFTRQGGESLWLQAAFDALYAHLAQENGIALGLEPVAGTVS